MGEANKMSTINGNQFPGKPLKSKLLNSSESDELARSQGRKRKKSKSKLTVLKDMTSTELIQSRCKHRRRQVFSQEGHNFVECLDCRKRLYDLDI